MTEDPPTGEPPSGRPPAPGSLGVVQRFLNTAHLPDGPDQLETVESATAWLHSLDVPAGRLSAGDVARLRETREAMRDLLETHSGNPSDEAVWRKLQGLLGTATLRAVVSANGVQMVPDGSGVQAFMAMVVTVMAEATQKGTWERLKICRCDTCRWAFFDHSKNNCGQWCTMQVCGSREKARSYRTRKRASVFGATAQ